MTSTTRQNNIILNQDWTRIYQTFKNADFKSYDFENLRRVILTYLRENYPEDFNDYIESSEYMALIDAIAFLGQSLSFRIDLASRENFIELADRRESVLRLARMLSYNVKRNISASGLLKFTSISTSENIKDSNGKNLSNQTITWNDPTNSNWLEQFMLVINSAMDDNQEFGRSQSTGTVQGINVEQYRLRSISNDVSVFSFSKSVASTGMTFEIVSTVFEDHREILEETPIPGNRLGFVYRNDNRGPGSQNTGFFLMFKQGSLEVADFVINTPTPNERVEINSTNINNNDIWLFRLNSKGQQVEQWEKVSSLLGNNIIFNSVNQNIRNIYSVETKELDKVDLVFTDGVYGNLPQGPFRAYYRVSNGLEYIISPNELRNISISVPYLNKLGERNILRISLSLQNSISSATGTENTDSIRRNAPAQYYTQNRMITAEDYNLAPLSSSQDILKVKALNRTSSGISRNFDIIDASGKYSSVNVFANDGYIYKEETEKKLSFKFTNKNEIFNFIKRNVEPLFVNPEIYNFYIAKYDKILFIDDITVWENVSRDVNQSTGFFKNDIDSSKLPVGQFSTSSLQYISPESLVKFESPKGMAFKDGELVVENLRDLKQTSKLWVKVIRVFGDGTSLSRSKRLTGSIVLNDPVPSGAIVKRVVPKFINNLPDDLEREMVNQMLQNFNFGLRFDINEVKWKIISRLDLNLIDRFSLGNTGDTSGNNLDSSWIVSFVKEPDSYSIRVRSLSYIFGSVKENRFYFDTNEKKYNEKIHKVSKDLTTVLGINLNTNNDILGTDISFEVNDTVKFNDGYESTSEVKVAFRDSDNDGVIDNPDSFEQIVGDDSELNFLFFKEEIDNTGNKIFKIQDNSQNQFKVRQRESQVNVNEFEENQLVYFYDPDENNIKRVNKITNTFDLESKFKASYGRDSLKFQYLHNASINRRIDPSVSNIIDVYLLVRSYDQAYRNFITGALITEPEVLDNNELSIKYGSKLLDLKSISDEIIYHPVKYKVLFGPLANEKLQAKFIVIKNQSIPLNNNELKVNIIDAVNDFFDINNWDFGDTFHIGELITFITNTLSPNISNIVIVPKQKDQSFGSLFEIQSRPDEIFISGASVDDIEIVPSISALDLQTVGQIITRT